MVARMIVGADAFAPMTIWRMTNLLTYVV